VSRPVYASEHLYNKLNQSPAGNSSEEPTSAIMPLVEDEPAFNGQPETHTFAGALFDMDGTIVDSTDAIIKHWHK
jgi:hypothetical protein